MAVTIVLNQRAIASLEIAASEAELNVRANRVLNAARRLVPRDKGTLAQSLKVTFSRTPNGMAVARIGSNLPYAMFVHEGTGLYGPRKARIYPRTATVLRWPAVNNSGSGRRRYKAGQTAAFVYARSTKGMKGTPFLLKALDAAK